MSPSKNRTHLLVAITLVGGLILTGLVTYQVWRHDRTEAELRFERLAERLSLEVQRRMDLPVYGLKGARGVFAASQSVETRASMGQASARARVMRRFILPLFSILRTVTLPMSAVLATWVPPQGW